MPFYETVFIARQELSPQQVEALTTQMTDILKKEGGKVVKIEQWGLRTLAYKINKARKAHYVLVEMDTPAPALLEMERNMRLNEDVLRFLTVKLEEPSKNPSPVIDRNNDNADRFASNEEAA